MAVLSPLSAPALALAMVLASGSGTVSRAADPAATEDLETSTLDPDDPHVVYVLDPALATSIYAVDGDEADMAGLISAGQLPNMVVSADRSRLAVVETFWSRGSRGERVDVVTAYDTASLSPLGEVVLPEGRILTVTKKWDAAETPDGRYVLSYNMTPAPSVSIVDIRAMKHVGEIETPNCGLVFPSAPARFSMLCADGSMLTASFDEEGNAVTSQSQVFFDAEQDPVFEHPAFDRRKARLHLISYDGTAYPVDLKDETPVFGKPWSLLNEDDKAKKWRPGGWQPVAVHPKSNRLFVMMHQGDRWTHKQAGTEVWVFNLESRKRIKRIRLEEAAMALAVSIDDEPQLYTLSEEGSLDIWDARTYEHEDSVEDLGDSPLVLYVSGE
jgi:methylamine dehydrogenase heavy chain